MRALLLAGLFLLSACSTTIVVRDFTAGDGDYSALKGKRVAIVNDRSSIPESHENWSDGHKFVIREINSGVTEALARRLTSSAKEIRVITPDAYGADKSKYDVALYPKVNVRVVNDFWTKGCLVKFELKLVTGGKVLATESQEFKKSFFSTPQAQSACRSAFSSVLGLVTDRTMLKARAN